MERYIKTLQVLFSLNSNFLNNNSFFHRRKIAKYKFSIEPNAKLQGWQNLITL